MKREFWAQFDLYEPFAQKGINIRNKQDNRQKRRIQQQARAEIEQFIFQGRIGQQVVPDFAARLSLLAQLLAVDCVCEGRTTQCKDYAKGEKGLQHWYYAGDLAVPRGDYQVFLCCRLRWMSTILNLSNHHDTVSPPLPDLSSFTPGSWAVRVTFTLRKPYLSKDDTDFYILDNPVKKEWVFKVPYVAPSQWKGALRAAMVRQLVEWWGSLNDGDRDPEEFARRRFRLFRLFGDEKGEEPGAVKGLAAYLDESGGPEAAEHFRRMVRASFNIPEDKPIPNFRGRLHFYPTFFDRIGLEVINPHPRDTGAGKQPIYFECVPAGTPGVFTLLYVPLDAGPKDEATIKADLAAVARGIRAMLTEYGFGAKTSSGYGVADVNEKTITINANGISRAQDDFRKYFRETINQM